MVAEGNGKGGSPGGRQKRMGPATPLAYKPAGGNKYVGPLGILGRVPALIVHLQKNDSTHAKQTFHMSSPNNKKIGRKAFAPASEINVARRHLFG